MTCELAQGQKLNEAALVTGFGVGRGPLRYLDGLQLVTRIPNAEARVMLLDRKSLSDLYAVREVAVREAMEGMACRLTASLMTDDEIAQMKALRDRHETQIRQEDGVLYAQSDRVLDFHDQIARGSRNLPLMTMLGNKHNQPLHMCCYCTSLIGHRTLQACITSPMIDQEKQP